MSLPGLESIWLPLRGELAGESAPPEVLAKTELELTAGRYTVRFGGEIADQGTYSLDPGTIPATLTLTGLKGHNAGRTIPAIFQLVGDRLRICYGLDGQRPTAFSTADGAKFYLVSYRRKVEVSA